MTKTDEIGIIDGRESGRGDSGMLSIAVCDDNQAFLPEIKAMLQKDERVDTILLYSQPDLLCADVTCGQTEPDVVLMDIDFQGKENGFYFAEKLYQIAPELPVIYMTGYSDRYAQLVFLTDANLVGYMTKPVRESILHQYLDKLAERCAKGRFFRFAARGKECNILAEEILYLESKNHAVAIHTDCGEYLVYEKLSSLAERLPSFFVQCHKSFLVNMKRIAQLSTGSIMMSDHSSIPISKSRQAQTRTAFLHHVWGTL
ncbi:MAG: LytTR family DNA-binding domain-containing protein [Clostridiales bacterium]|nr:LytTR family DNA-binding domain-containing protein [Clostridiales bacterium]